MCFSSKSSLYTLIIGIVSSILLIYYGNTKYTKENLIGGIFVIFVSIMQFFDYLFWNDLDNKKGTNKIGTLFAPLFNHLQPTFLYYLLCTIYNKFNILYFMLNLLYFIYVIIKYVQFISNSNNLITNVKYGHLYWKWKLNFNYIFYLLIFIFNIFIYIPLNYALLFFIICFSLLFISNKFYYNNMGETWCYFSAYSPLFLLLFSYFI